MIIAPYSSSRLGATVTPADVGAAGFYTIGALANKGPEAFPGADQVVSCKLWPTNYMGLAAIDNNLATLELTELRTQSTTAHYHWYCYGGWNYSLFDPDGNAISSSTWRPLGMSVYNATPYVLKWGINNPPFDITTIGDAQLNSLLMPGGVMTFDGPITAYYYANVYGTFGALFTVGTTLQMEAVMVHAGSVFPPAYGYTGYVEVTMFGIKP